MKKLVVILMAILAVAALSGGYRTSKATVESIRDGLVSVTDAAGEAWDFYGEDFVPQEEVVLVFKTGWTTSIEDDEIINVL